MKTYPSYIVIHDDYTNKTTIVKTTDKKNLINELFDRATGLKVSFHVTAGFAVGENEAIIKEY